MIWVILLSITSFLASVLGFETTINAPSEKSKKYFRIGFIILGVLTIVAAIPQYVEEEKRENNTSQTLATLKTNSLENSAILNQITNDAINLQIYLKVDSSSNATATTENNQIITNGFVILAPIKNRSTENLNSRKISFFILNSGSITAEHVNISFSADVRLKEWIIPTGDWQSINPSIIPIEPLSPTLAFFLKWEMEFSKSLPPNRFEPAMPIYISTNCPVGTFPSYIDLYADNSKIKRVFVFFKIN